MVYPNLKMNSLKSIELLFDPDLFSKGEELYQNGAVQEIIKLNSSLYNLIIREGKVYEVELLKPLLKGQKYSCDCSFYKSNKTCKHIVAALLYFKEYKSQLKSTEKAKVSSKPKYKSITTRSLLNQIDDESLRQFVLGYASRDKKFSDALKVNFIRQIDLEDNERKYKTLLDSLIKPISSKHAELKETEVRNFKNVIKDLLEQAHDALALKEYLEASYIIKTVLLKLHYLDHYFTERYDELEPFFIEFYKVYKELLDRTDLAVDLKDKLYDNLIELVDSSFYHSKINKYNGFEILFTSFDYSIESLEHIVNYSEKTNRTKDELAIAYSQIFRLKKELGIDNPFELNNSLSPIAENIIKNTIDVGASSIAEEIAMHFKNKYPEEIAYITLLLEMYLKSGKEAEFVETIISSFIKTKDLRLIDLINQYKLTHILQEVRERMKDQMPGELNLNARANLLKKLQDWDSLMAMMYEIKDIRTLMNYDSYLFEQFPEEVSYLYLLLIEDYLDKHLGDFATVFIDELSAHFRKKNLKKILSKMNKLISEKYSHRSKLSSSIYK